MMKRCILIMLAALLITQAGIGQSRGTFTDPRDGQTYKTITVKGASTGTKVTWMAQNLNYKMQESYAYDDKEGNREELGLLYTWEAAKKACPNGWYLPTDKELSDLVDEFGGPNKAGEALKSAKGWKENDNGTNSSGFNGLPAGLRNEDGGYSPQGCLGGWWSSSLASPGKAWAWSLQFANANRFKVFRFDVFVSSAASVRCVRN